MFGKSENVPGEISEVGLRKWYSGLSDRDKVRLNRYLGGSDRSSAVAFYVSVIKASNNDHNYALSILVGEQALSTKLSDREKFDINEELILAYFGSGRYDDCEKHCDMGLSMLKFLQEKILKENGGVLPERLVCRNYKINVVVGVRYDYDEGDRILDKYFEDGLISKEDLEYRKQSHKIYRLQKTFDGIYSLKLKE